MYGDGENNATCLGLPMFSMYTDSELPPGLNSFYTLQLCLGLSLVHNVHQFGCRL